MQAIRLYINDIEIELSSDEKVYLSSKVNEIGKPENIKSSVTQTFKIYKTSKNLETFEYLGLSTGTTNIPYSDVDVRLYVNGFEAFKRAKIGNIKNRNNYWNIIIKEGNANFFSAISEYSIRDLDLSSYEDFWRQAEIIAANTNTEGQIYPIIDWGVLDTHSNYIDCREMFPAVFEKTIWDAIFDKDKNPAISENWNYEGNIFEDNNFTKAIIPCVTSNAGSTTNTNLGTVAKNTADFMVTTAYVTRLYSAVLDNVVTDEYGLVKSDVSTLVYNTLYFYEVAISGSYTVKFECDYSKAGADFILFNFTFRIRTLTDVLASKTEAFILFNEGSSSVEVTADFEKGDYIICTIESQQFFDIQIDSNTMTVTADCAEANLEYDVQSTLKFPLAANLPDVSQKDFIKQRMLINGLIPQSSIINNKIEFIKFEQLLKNRDIGNYQDYSDKIDLTGIADFDASNVSKEYEISGFAKRNNVNYKNDNTVLSSLGNSYFVLESERYKGEKKYIELIYGATEMVFRLNSSKRIPLINIFDLDDDSNVKRTNTVSNRILSLDLNDRNIQYQDGISTDNETTNIPDCNFVNFEWINLLENYYQDLINAVSKPEIVSAKYLIDAFEFSNFNHFYLVFDKNLNGFFYVEEINKFSPDKSTEFKMLRVE